jgi:hypothetical protein
MHWAVVLKQHRRRDIDDVRNEQKPKAIGAGDERPLTLTTTTSRQQVNPTFTNVCVLIWIIDATPRWLLALRLGRAISTPSAPQTYFPAFKRRALR